MKTLQIQNLGLFWDCCKGPKSVISGNLSKNGYVWGSQWPTLSELKIKVDPSLDRPWCEFFKIIKSHDPKNPTQGVIWVPIQACHLSEKKWQLSCPLWRCPWFRTYTMWSKPFKSIILFFKAYNFTKYFLISILESL